jgi:hypothetical protein
MRSFKTVKGSHSMVGGWNLLKISAPLPLMKIYKMRPLSARSTLLDSSGGQRYSKMYRLKRYRYTTFKKKIE